MSNHIRALMGHLTTFSRFGWVVKGGFLFYSFFVLLEARGPRLCLQTGRNSLNLLESMLIHVKLSDRWPESQQPDSETDYKWAKRQQPLACCGATDDSRGGQEVESSVLNPPPSFHLSINPSPLLATIHSGWLIDKGKWEHSVVKIIHHVRFSGHVLQIQCFTI